MSKYLFIILISVLAGALLMGYFIIPKRLRNNYAKVVSSLIKEFVSIGIVFTLWKLGYDRIYKIEPNYTILSISILALLSISTLVLIAINNLDELFLKKWNEVKFRGYLFTAIIVVTTSLAIDIYLSYNSIYSISNSLDRNAEKYGGTTSKTNSK